MVIHRWNNQIQEAICQEWTEACQEIQGRQAKRVLRKRLSEKYGLTSHIVQAIVELAATEGLNRIVTEGAKTDTHKWEPINYHQLVGDLKERVNVLEKKFEFLLDGIQRVLEDGEAMQAHVGHLRKMGKWMQKRNALDMQEMTQVPQEFPVNLPEVRLPSGELDEGESPYQPDIGSQNTISDRTAIDVPPKDERERKRGEIKTKPRATYDELGPLEKIERLRGQVNSARTRGELLFREIKEGKKALPR